LADKEGGGTVAIWQGKRRPQLFVTQGCGNPQNSLTYAKCKDSYIFMRIEKQEQNLDQKSLNHLRSATLSGYQFDSC
jgi:hypothetical protein